MTYRDEVLAWAESTAGVLALKALAEDMPGVYSAKKSEVVAWLMANDFDLLSESYRLTLRRL